MFSSKLMAKLIIGSSLVLTFGCGKAFNRYGMNDEPSTSKPRLFTPNDMKRVHSPLIDTCIADIIMHSNFFEAVERNDLKSIQRLLKLGANINATQYGSTALHLAVKNNKEETVQLLLKYKTIQINDKDIEGMTPLHWAVFKKYVPVVELLVKDQRIQVNQEDKHGSTPLHGAVEYNLIEIIELLLTHGCKVNVQNEHGVSPLHLAVESDNVKLVELLLTYGARVNAQNKYGIAPLHLAAEKGNLALVELLVKNGCKINQKDNKGYNALHKAAEKGNINVVRFLVCEALGLTDRRERKFIVSSLLKSKTFSLDTALDLAEKKGHRACVKFLRSARRNNVYRRCIIL